MIEDCSIAIGQVLSMRTQLAGVPLWTDAEVLGVQNVANCLSHLSPEQSRKLSGNMMHLAVVGAVILSALLSI